jgi:DNA-directed RNA polymerase subunit RPC12/RpoP
MPSLKYTCSACGEQLESDLSDDEAMKESKLLWGDLQPSDLAIICDDCFKGGIGDALAEKHVGEKPH